MKNNRLLTLDNQAKIIPKPLMMVLLSLFTVWQMGIIFYRGTTLSLFGRAPIPVNSDITTLVMAFGYIATIAANIAFFRHTVIMGRVAIAVAFVAETLMLLPLPPKLLAAFLYVSFFCCVFFIGTNYNVESSFFENKSDLKFGFVSAFVQFIPMIILQGDIFNIPYVAYKIISILILAALLYVMLALPKGYSRPLISFKEAASSTAIPKRASVGIYVAVFASTLSLMFGLTISETVKYGLGIFYGSRLIATFVAVFLVFKVRISPFKLFTFSFALNAVGFVCAALSLIYPQLVYVAIVLIGTCALLSNLAGFAANTVFVYKPAKYVGQLIVVIGFVIALLQAILLEVFRDTLSVLFAILSIAAVSVLVMFLGVESNLSYLWRKMTAKDADALPDTAEAACADEIQPEATEEQAAPENRLVGISGLAPREQKIVNLILMGYTNPEIAKQLFISENTVKSYRKEIYFKLDVHSRRELFALCERE